MPLQALIFTLDVLTDTLPWRTHAWDKLLGKHGIHLPCEILARKLGQNGVSPVPPAVQPGEPEIDFQLGKEMQECRREFSLALRPGSEHLLEQASRRGLRLALWCGQSGLQEIQLHGSERCLNMDCFEYVDATCVTDAEAAARSLAEACAALQLSPLQCGLVGSNALDAQAARLSGLAFLGITPEPETELRLRRVAARGVWANCQELQEQLKEALLMAAPGKIVLSQSVQHSFMAQALDAARGGLEHGEAPIGCALFSGSGQLLASSWNAMNGTQNKSAHAEIMAFAAAAGKAPLEAKDLVLVSTLEPCVMCLGAAMEAGVDAVLYGLEAPYDGGARRVDAPQSPESQMPRILGPIAREPARALFQEWLQANEKSPGADFVRQLLGD